MKKTGLKFLGKRGMAITLMLAMIGTLCSGFTTKVKADSTDESLQETIFDTGISVPLSGNLFVGLRGEYIYGTKQAIERVNEIRKEACEEGINGLTKDDYVPIKWSSDLEEIAMIRAAEQAVIYPVSHQRPRKYSKVNGQIQGDNCFSAVSSNNIGSSGEVIAYCSWKADPVTSINQWYEEKEDLVNSTGGQTGHYLAMINPNNIYFGVATFCSSDATWMTTSAGEFLSKNYIRYKYSNVNLSENSVITEDVSGIKKIETAPQYLTNSKITSCPGNKALSSTIYEGDKISCEVMYDFYAGRKNASVKALENVIWETSDSSVAKVDQNGNITFVNSGVVTITAVLEDGTEMDVDLVVKPEKTTTTTQKITTTQRPTTTQRVTTTERLTTTQRPTTTQKVTTTQRPTTTQRVTTTERLTTTQRPTTTQKVTTTQRPTTTQRVTTTERLTTTQRPTTTQKVTTTQNPATTEDANLYPTTETLTTEDSQIQPSTEPASTEITQEYPSKELSGPKKDSEGNIIYDCVYFGTYPQSDVSGASKDPIKWRVLSVNGQDAFLVADKNLDAKPYNETSDTVTWKTSTIRSWLNGYGESTNAAGIDYTNDNFINSAFTNEEQVALQSVILKNANNPDSEYNTAGGAKTKDKVYLLSYEDITNADYGFSTTPEICDNARLRENTDYANKAGASQYWWLRTPGWDSYNAIDVMSDGSVNIEGDFTDDLDVAICPAIHLDLSSDVYSYAGTVEIEKNLEEDADEDEENTSVIPGEEDTENTSDTSVTPGEEDTDDSGDTGITSGEEDTDDSGDTGITSGEEDTDDSGDTGITSGEEDTENPGDTGITSGEEDTDDSGNTGITSGEEDTENLGNTTVTSGNSQNQSQPSLKKPQSSQQDEEDEDEEEYDEEDSTSNNHSGNSTTQNTAKSSNVSTDEEEDEWDDEEEWEDEDEEEVSSSKPKKVKGVKTKVLKAKKVKVSWKKVSKASGYQIAYASNNKFKNKKTKYSKKTSITLKKLKSKTYYIKVRAYRKVNGKKIYGAWSKAKKVKR